MANSSIVKRTEQEHYMNLGTESSRDFKRMGEGWSKIDDGSSAKTETVKYINMDTEATDTTGYTVSYPFEADLMYADPTIKKVYDTHKDRKILGECEVEMLTVDKFDGNDTDGYTARLEKVAIAVSSISENNNKMRMSGSFNGKSDPIKGKAKFADGVVTFTPDTAASE